eukprot:Skav205886  [mRNA]  locus=scaffold123:16538:18973:+ [translate_table: standard]
MAAALAALRRHVVLRAPRQLPAAWLAVRNWNEQKGFGFISPSEGGEDVFVHRSGLADGMDALSPGASVSFLPQWDEKKRKDRASDVQISSETSSPASSGPGALLDSRGHRVTLRSDAPKGKESGSVREEFQIVGNKSWELRFYPAGGDKEEVVVLKPGGPGSKAALGSTKKGHGRNWAVEGAAVC